MQQNHATRQRAYTLIEIAIALAVLGILLGGALLPLQEQLRQRAFRNAEQHLENAKQAVFVYALQNRTIARTVEYHDGIHYELPAARPYLPCPDIDNDGLEDRDDDPTPFSPPISIFPTVSVKALTTNLGLCQEQKGMLAWKTLGLAAVDPWGNRLTYRVDSAFSDSIFGFDELTRADIFDRRQKLRDPNNEQLYSLRDSRDKIGGIICTDFINNAGNGGCPNAALSNVAAGVVTSVKLTLRARAVPAYQVNSTAVQGLLDGAVFVILSHGSNGNGAVAPHHATRTHSCRPLATTTPATDARIGEVANAYYRPGHRFVTDTGIGCTSANAGNLLWENLFVSAPIRRGGSDMMAMDDIVVWSSNSELIGALLRSGALPIPRLPYLPE